MADIPLWMLIGLPGSGKSTWAQQFQQASGAIAVISTDQIRAELFGHEATQGPWPRVWSQVTQELQWVVSQAQQQTVPGAIYDATNAQRKVRRRVIQTALAMGFTRLLAVWVDVPLEECLKRNQTRSRQVPSEVIRAMHRQLSGAPPHPDEGFAAVYRLCPNCLGGEALNLPTVDGSQLNG